MSYILPNEPHLFMMHFLGAGSRKISDRIANLGGGETKIKHLSPDLIVERSFSNKPTKTRVYADQFGKIENYVALFSGPAI